VAIHELHLPFIVAVEFHPATWAAPVTFSHLFTLPSLSEAFRSLPIGRDYPSPLSKLEAIQCHRIQDIRSASPLAQDRI
jgi:hypothetical protein